MSQKLSKYAKITAPLLGAGAIGVCPLCWAGSAAFLSYVGLGAFIPLWKWLVFALLGAGLVGLAFDYRSHKKWRPLVLFLIGSVALYLGRYVFVQVVVWVGGAIFILGAVIDNKLQFKKPEIEPNEVESETKDEQKIIMDKTTLTCPHCKTKQEVEIPNDKCLALHLCESCGKMITVPKESKNCCVVCEFSEDKCPVAE